MKKGEAAVEAFKSQRDTLRQQVDDLLTSGF